MNISKFATKVGVSKSTISNYLNGKTAKMSEKTELKIKKAIEEYGYVPNLGARHLNNTTKSKTIGIVLEKTTLGSMFYTSFFSHVHQGINEVLNEYGYRALIIPEQDEDQNASSLDYIKGLGCGLVDGFLLFNIQENDKYIVNFEKMKIPFMCFGQIEQLGINNYVGSEHMNGIKIALNHFYEQGISNIVAVVGHETSIVSTQLKKGYVDFFIEKEVPINDELILSKNDNVSESIYEDCKKLFSLADFPRAFILPRLHLDALLKAAKEVGRKPYIDFYFILLDYFPFDEKENAYSYIKAPVYDLGKAAAKKLVEQINGTHITSQMFPMELICRLSCGCKNM